MVNLAALTERIRAIPGNRILIGICGAPGAGKSTLATQLTEALPDAVYVGMDGFHLAQAELTRLGRTDRKGAPDTFDAAGYVNLLRRLQNPPDEVIYAPDFRRDLEEPIAGAIPVAPETRVVITEGNYLLLPTPPWQEVHRLLTETWFLAPPEETRRARLLARHQAYGRTESEARERTLGSDERNAVLINSTASTADLIIR